MRKQEVKMWVKSKFYSDQCNLHNYVVYVEDFILKLHLLYKQDYSKQKFFSITPLKLSFVS